MQRPGKKQKISGQFVPISYRMIDSLAWKSLSGNSIKVYIQLMRKCNGNNDRDLSLTYAEMKTHLSPATFRKCMTELVETGFVDLVRQGGIERQCNIFGISERWKHYHTQNYEFRTLKKWNISGFKTMWESKRAEEKSGESIKIELSKV